MTKTLKAFPVSEGLFVLKDDSIKFSDIDIDSIIFLFRKAGGDDFRGVSDWELQDAIKHFIQFAEESGYKYPEIPPQKVFDEYYKRDVDKCYKIIGRKFLGFADPPKKIISEYDEKIIVDFFYWAKRNDIERLKIPQKKLFDEWLNAIKEEIIDKQNAKQILSENVYLTDKDGEKIVDQDQLKGCELHFKWVVDFYKYIAEMI